MIKSKKYIPYDCPAYLTGVADRYMKEGLMKKFQQFSGYNISGEQWHILMFLYQEDGLTQKELSQRMGKSKVSIVKAINLLEGNSLAVRIQSENDLRNKRVYLTPKGKEVEKDILALVNQNKAEIFKGISSEEIDAYKKTLRKMISNTKP